MSVLSRELRDEEFRREFCQENLVFDIGEFLCEAMKEAGISRAELAEKLGTKEKEITDILRGSTDFTVRRISNIFFALGKYLHVEIR